MLCYLGVHHTRYRVIPVRALVESLHLQAAGHLWVRVSHQTCRELFLPRSLKPTRGSAYGHSRHDAMIGHRPKERTSLNKYLAE